MNSSDKKLIAGIILFAILGLIGNHIHTTLQSGKKVSTQAVIKAEGTIVRTIVLSDGAAESFLVMGKLGNEKVEISGNKIRIAESPCPDQICVKQGWISMPGQSIICVPGSIVIYIEGESSVDAILR